MVCESVQLLNCSLENVFKGISCRGIRDGWEIFLKLENKNVKFQFLPWSLYVFHQEFGGLVKEAGSGLKRRKDCKTTNVYPRGMGWLFTLTSKWLLLQPGVLNQSCMLWSGWVPKLIFGKLELGLSRHVSVSSGTRITFCPTGVLFYQSSDGAGDRMRHFAAHMSSDRDFLVRSLSWYFTRCCLAFIKLRSVFIYLFICDTSLLQDDFCQICPTVQQQIAFFRVWDMQKGVLRVGELLHLHALQHAEHCWGRSRKGLLWHQWPVSHVPLSAVLWSEPRAVITKSSFSRGLWGHHLRKGIIWC